MRRLLALVLPLLVLAVACGDGTSTSGGDTTVAATDTTDAAASSTSSPAKPTVAVPETLPTELVVTDLTEGTGPAAAVGDEVVLNYVGVRSADGIEFDNSYDRGEPFQVLLGAGKVIPGWEQGLVGVQAGGRRQMDIPSDLAYGDQGAGDVIKPGDALSFVVDVIAVLSGTSQADQPAITVAPAGNISVIDNKDLIVGTGATPTNGTQFAAQIMLFRADTGELLNSTWGSPGVVFSFTTDSNTYPGIIAAAKGMKVGGRRQSQLPYQLMFDGQGQTQINLPAAIDVVIVMDLIAVY